MKKIEIYSMTTITNGQTWVSNAPKFLMFLFQHVAYYKDVHPALKDEVIRACAMRKAELAYIDSIFETTGIQLKPQSVPVLYEDEYALLSPEQEEFLTWAYALVYGKTDGIPVYDCKSPYGPRCVEFSR